jgi:hypothetical protein
MCTDFLQVKWLKENMYKSRKGECVSDSEVMVMFVTSDREIL